MASPAHFVEDLSLPRTVPFVSVSGDIFHDDTTIYHYDTTTTLTTASTDTNATTAMIAAAATTTTTILTATMKNLILRSGMGMPSGATNFSKLMDNDDDHVSSYDQMYEGTDTFFTLRYTFSVIRLCLAIFGVLANSVTCYVLTYKKLWSPTTLLLMTLVIYDAVFLLASIPLCLVDAFFNVDMDTFAIICGIFYPIRYMAQTGSIYTLGTLTVERYLIVLRPFKARIFCSFGKIKRFIIFIFFFSIIFNIPRCFFYTLATSFAQAWATNVTAFQNGTSAFVPEISESVAMAAEPTDMSASMAGDSSYEDHVAQNAYVENTNSLSESVKRHEYYVWLYTRVYELYTSGVFLYLLPYALIPLLNFQLLLAIKQRRHETRSISLKDEHRQLKKTKATNREDGLTMIVLGITVCFFVCCLIPAIYNVTQIANVPATMNFSIYLLIASDTMLCVNASTDFFFYCLLGAKFRNTFLHIFCKKSDCVTGGGAGRSPLTNGQSRHSDTYYHTVV